MAHKLAALPLPGLLLLSKWTMVCIINCYVPYIIIFIALEIKVAEQNGTVYNKFKKKKVSCIYVYIFLFN